MDRPRSLTPWLSALGSGLLACVTSCAVLDEGNKAWSVSFACEADRLATEELELRVLRDGCEGEDAVYEATLRRGEAAPALRSLASGTFGFAARALGTGGALVASGCMEHKVPSSAAIAISLRSDTCLAEELDAALSESEAGMSVREAGMSVRDAAADSGGGTDAASPPFDAAQRADASAARDGAVSDDDSGPSQHEQDAATSDAAVEAEAGTPPCSEPCADDNPCTYDVCIAGTCQNVPFSGSAECDEIACTVGDVCSEGVCVPGQAVDQVCPGGSTCRPQVCDPSVGCVASIADGVPCTDNLACTAADTCVEGECVGTSTCPQGAACGSAGCTCGGGLTLCPDACADLASSNAHCGECGHACKSGQSCVAGACKPDAAPSNCVAHRDAGHDYLTCPDRLSWQNARNRCRQWGLDLAVIGDAAENDFIRQIAGGSNRCIGANDIGSGNCVDSGSEGSWYWIAPGTDNQKGQEFCEIVSSSNRTCAPKNGAYTNWRGKEPNNDGCCSSFLCSNDGEDCGGIYGDDGTWNDFDCSPPTDERPLLLCESF